MTREMRPRASCFGVVVSIVQSTRGRTGAIAEFCEFYKEAREWRRCTIVLFGLSRVTIIRVHSCICRRLANLNDHHNQGVLISFQAHLQPPIQPRPDAAMRPREFSRRLQPQQQAGSASAVQTLHALPTTDATVGKYWVATRRMDWITEQAQ